MIRAATITVALLAAGFAAIQLVPQAVGQTGPGWVTLTDGKTMGDWNSTGEANWRIEDGALVADKGKGGHLVTKNSYKNFQINAEFWADEDANSGIFIRCKIPLPSAPGPATRSMFSTSAPTRATAPARSSISRK